ncbi:hypothetical protein AV530_016489 [Patagioenas fasciata monilis]|uniref:Uncharacterized protein n=1 Tax=Patagioenas fasciata monilis TaxID=372326 RepID=A0A1V4J2B3_PATFA|nr:hypothetical protein AV530_016489 [Patagioenas fasciata monilis]
MPFKGEGRVCNIHLPQRAAILTIRQGSKGKHAPVGTFRRAKPTKNNPGKSTSRKETSAFRGNSQNSIQPPPAVETGLISRGGNFTRWKIKEERFFLRSRCPHFIHKIDQSDMMVKIQTQFHPLSMGIQLQASCL